MAGQAADVFVSYKAEDRRRVRPLVEALETEGFTVWWDEQIGGGDEWRRSIETHLDEALSVIVVWSRRSISADGQFVRDEATRAQRRGTYLPVTIDKIEPPLGFGERHAIDLVRWAGDRTDRRFRAVVASVRAISTGEAPRPFANPTSRLVGRRTIIAATGVGFLAAGVGGWFLFRPPAAEASDSIAVLPFDNLSGDPSQAFFSDGIAEELRSALSRIPQLRVVARTSSEAVRNEDAKTAAHRLGVGNILTGSVRRSPSLIRVSAQLVDGRTGIQRWSEDFDQPNGDTLTIQSNIAQRVAQALRIQLAGATQQALTLGGTRNPAAHDLFLKAKLGRTTDTPDGFQRSMAQLDAATQLDPGYAQAFALKAGTLALYSSLYTRDPAQLAKDTDEAAATARRAIMLAPALASGHSALSLAYRHQLKLRDAWQEMRAAIALPGDDSETEVRLAMILIAIGRSDAAQKAAARAVLFDPLNPGVFTWQALVLYLARRYAPAIAAARRSLELNPSGVFARGILVNSLIMMGRNEQAAPELTKLPADSAWALTARAIIAARKQDRTGFDNSVRQLHANWGDSVNSEFAQIYAQRGDVDTAIVYLKKPVAQRNGWFQFIATDPLLDPMRGDPRFKEIIRGLDLPA